MGRLASFPTWPVWGSADWGGDNSVKSGRTRGSCNTDPRSELQEGVGHTHTEEEKDCRSQLDKATSNLERPDGRATSGSAWDQRDGFHFWP